MCNLHRGPSIDHASYKVSVHLAKGFQTEPIVFCKSHLCAFFFIEFLSGMCSTDFVITFDLRISKGTNDQKFLIFYFKVLS
jgi:hypothetical protein